MNELIALSCEKTYLLWFYLVLDESNIFFGGNKMNNKISSRLVALLLCFVLICLSTVTFVGANEHSNVICLTECERLSWDRYTGNLGDSQIEALDGSNLRNGNEGLNGEKYHNGFEAWIARWNFKPEISWVSSIYNLEAKYERFTGKTSIINCYNKTNFDTTLSFYGDGNLLYSQVLTDENYSFEFDIDVSEVTELKIYIEDNTAVKGGTSFALYDLFLFGDNVISEKEQTEKLPEISEYKGNTYQLFEIGLSWDDAVKYCEDLGGHLAVISSQEEQTVIENLILNGEKNFYWLGGYREGDSWKTVTGESFELYTNWKYDEPNNAASPDEENKLQIFAKTSGNYIFGEWNDLSNNAEWKNDYFGINNCGFICEWEKPAETYQGVAFKSGYNVLDDKYKFLNNKDNIPEKIYCDIFGDEKGKLLYNSNEIEDGSLKPHGLCYGFAASTGAMFLDFPAPNTFYRGLLNFCEKISDIKMNSKCWTLDSITMKNFIYYAYATQCSVQANVEYKSFEEIYQAVYDYVYNDGLPVVLSIKRIDYDKNTDSFDQSFGHAVIAVGIEDGNKIIVDDSNIKELQKIELIKDTNGDFTGEWSYGTYGELIFCDNDMTQEEIKQNGSVSILGIRPNSVSLLATLVLDNAVEFETDWVKVEEEVEDKFFDFEPIDQDYNLIYIGADKYDVSLQSGEDLLPIKMLSSEVVRQSDFNKTYWMKNNDSIKLVDVVGNDGVIQIAGNDVSVRVDLVDYDDISIKFDEINNEFDTRIDATVGKEYSVVYSSTMDDGSVAELVIEGIARENSVTSVRTESGIEVKGLENATVSVNRNNETLKQEKIGNTYGFVVDCNDEYNFEITVDEKELESERETNDDNEKDSDSEKVNENQSGKIKEISSNKLVMIIILFFVLIVLTGIIVFIIKLYNKK